MDKIIVVFCEGDHDIALIKRILFIYGYKAYDKKIKDFLKPLDGLYKSTFSQKKIEDRKLGFQPSNIETPHTVLSNNENLIVLHNLGGDSTILSSKSLDMIKMYTELNDEILRDAGRYDELNFRFLYFLDADDEGLQNRLDQFKCLLQLDEVRHHEIAQYNNSEVACYIFHDANHPSKNGKLEDLLLELMKIDNLDIFKNSIDYLQTNLLDESRCRRFISDKDEEKYKAGIKFKEQKSIISIAGQLQFSGSSNSVIISNTDYIKKNDILNNGCCSHIASMF